MAEQIDTKISIDEMRRLLKYIARGYKVPEILYKVIKEVCIREIEQKRKPVLLKRDPNIERDRLQAAYPIITDGATIELCPTVLGGWGADFDGDTTLGYVLYYYNDSTVYNLNIKDFINFNDLVLIEEKTKDNGVIVKNYKVLNDVYVDAIDNNTGDITKKKITNWSEHSNVKMYKISRKAKLSCISDIPDLWVSDNHSMVVYDSENQILKRDTPQNISNLKKSFLIKNRINLNTSESCFKFLNIPTYNKIDDSEIGYFLGSWLGDGYLTYEISGNYFSYNVVGFTNSDDDISDKWISILKKITKNIITEKEDRKSKYPNAFDFKKKDGSNTAVAKRSKVSDVKLGPELMKHFGKGAEGKFLPNWILNMSNEFIYSLIAGYADTDGTINKEYITIQSKSKELIESFQRLLKLKLNIDSSTFHEIKKYILTENGDKIDVKNDEDKWRHYYTLNIKVNNGNLEHIKNIKNNMINLNKSNLLLETINKYEKMENKNQRSVVYHIPYQLVENMSIKDRKEKLDLTNDHIRSIKLNNYTQKIITIPEDLIDSSDLSDTCKNLLKKQNNGEIEFIPCEFLDITYDPEVTVGYDFTIEDYYTFTTADGIFLYDTMAVYSLLSEEAHKEITDKMISPFTTSGYNHTNYKLSKEMVAGIFTMTFLENDNQPLLLQDISKAVEMDVGNKVKVNNYKTFTGVTTAGRIVLNGYLPNYVPFINQPIDSKYIASVLDKIRKLNPDEFIKTVNGLYKLGFKYSTIYPQSLSLSSLDIPEEIYKLKKELSETKIPYKQQEIISKMDYILAEHLKKNHQDLYIIIKSGSAKGFDQIRQVLAAKGVIKDPNGELLPPISESIGEGYSIENYFNQASPSRKGVADRAINTAKGGYMYRIALSAFGDVTANIQNPDCGTRKTLRIKLTPDLLKRMEGRWCVNNKGGLERVDEKMVGQFINLRSPIYCKTRDICRICYGDLLYQLKSKNVGSIAAGSILSLSETIMKSFHCTSKDMLLYIDYNNHKSVSSFENIWNKIDSEIVSEDEQEYKLTNDLLVWDHDKFTKVEKILRHKKNPNTKMVMTRSNNADFTVCQDNHPLILSKNEDVCKSCDTPFIKTKKTGRWICPKCNTYKSQVHHKSDDIYKKVKPSEFVKSKYFSKNSFPIWQNEKKEPLMEPYLFGMFLAEGSYLYYYGYKLVGLTFSQNTGEILDHIENCLINEGYAYKNNKTKNGKKSTLIMYDESFAIQMMNQTDRYCYQKSIGEDYIYYSDEDLSKILCGFIDGDGCYVEDKIRSTILIETTSLKLCQQFHHILTKFNIDHNITLAPVKKLTRHQSYILKIYPTQDDVNMFKYSLKVKDRILANRYNRTRYSSLVDYSKDVMFDDEEYVYDLTTETGTLTINGILNSNTGGIAQIHKLDLHNECMKNLTSTDEPLVKSLMKQVDETAYSKVDNLQVIIDKTIFKKDEFKIKSDKEKIILPVGYFTIKYKNFNIDITIEQEVVLFKNSSTNETDNIVSIMYSAEEKFAILKSYEIAPEKTAQALQKVLSGYDPFRTPEELYLKLYNKLKTMNGADSVHYEVVVSNLLRYKFNPRIPARLKPENYNAVTFSIKSLPQIISPIGGLIFENVSKSLIDNMLHDRTANPSAVEKLFMGEHLSPLAEKFKK